MEHETQRYGSFSVRFLANLIDSFLINLIPLLTIYLIVASSITTASIWVGLLWIIVEILVLIILTPVYSVFTYLYFQASIGKYLSGLSIVRADSKKPTIANGLMRFYVGYFVSTILYLGFLSIINDPKKQGFHDHIAGTYVIKKRSAILGIVALVILILLYLGLLYSLFAIISDKQILVKMGSDLTFLFKELDTYFKSSSRGR